MTRQFHDALLGLGYADDVDLFYVWAPDELHNEAAWRMCVPGALSACSRAGWLAP